MEHANEVRVCLTLTSKKYSPEEVTLATGLQPTKTWRMEDWIVGTARSYDWNGWSLASGLDMASELEDHLSALLTRLEPAMSALKELSCRWDLEVSCVIYAKVFVQPCHFDRETIQKLASLGAQIDVDFYCCLESGS